MSQFKIIKMMEQEVSTRVRIIPTPGHTPGGISIFLETVDGPYVIAGDVVMLSKALNLTRIRNYLNILECIRI
jgi:glyoxylase-like metal-dependent hydrolase (beta-lactamase superfamily II)